MLGQGQQPNLRIIHESWTPQQGAPENILALAQTSDGFLWLAGSTGLFRFDGIHFEPFHAAIGDQLISTNIYKIFAPPTGGLWVGYTFGGFSFINNGRVQNYGGKLATSTGSVRDFAQDEEGNLWAGTSSGLWQFDSAQWQHIGPEWNGPSRAIYQLKFDRHGALWVLEERRFGRIDATLLCLKPGAKRFEIIEDHLSYGFTLDADGRVVTAKAGRRLGDLHQSSDGELSEYPVLIKDNNQFLDRSNGLWIFGGSDQEPLLRTTAPAEFKNTWIQHYDAKAEKYDVHPTFWLIDREENIWFAEPRIGIHRFFYSPLNKQGSPFQSAYESAIVADDNGAVWMTSWLGSKLCQIRGGAVKCLPIRGNTFWSFAYRAMDGTFWFGGNTGLWHYAKGKLLHIALPPEMAADAAYMQAITEDRSGGAWISFGRQGLYRLTGDTWTPYGGREELPKTGVVTEFTDALGRVWFGYTKNVLAVLDGERIHVFGPSDGLRVGNINAISGHGPEIWIGGENGLQQFDRGQFRDIAPIDGKWTRGISGIVETPDGDLWLNGANGIFHIPRKEILQALTVTGYQVGGEHFGSREGAPGAAAQLRPLQTAIRDSDGRLWFAGSNGIVWLDPGRRQPRKIAPPPVVITSVSANDKNYDPASPLIFPEHTSDVRINYAAVSLSDPQAVRFRYKLQETDKGWHESDAAIPVTYRNLSPGIYHFRVNASDTNGLWTDKIAVADFTILPAWYQTVLFRSFVLVMVPLVLLLAHRLRVGYVAGTISARSDERLAERTRMARELHDTFIQTIQGSKMVVDDALEKSSDAAGMHRALTQLASWLERAIHESRAALNSLRESTTERNDLRVAFQRLTESSFIPSSMAVSLSVVGTTREMHPIVRDEVYRIGYEAIRNASQHSRASRLDVEVRYNGDFSLRVKDNGVGIDPNMLDTGKEGHFGLLGMRERAGRIGGKLTLFSNINAGTVISLVVPGIVVYRSGSESLLTQTIGGIRKAFRRMPN